MRACNATQKSQAQGTLLCYLEVCPVAVAVLAKRGASEDAVLKLRTLHISPIKRPTGTATAEAGVRRWMTTGNSKQSSARRSLRAYVLKTPNTVCPAHVMWRCHQRRNSSPTLTY
jgi:hypothetical protein